MRYDIVSSTGQSDGGSYQSIHGTDQPLQPPSPLGIPGQRDGNVTNAVTFDDGAIGMKMSPGAGFTVNAGAWV